MSDAVTTAPGTPPIIRMEGVNKWDDSSRNWLDKCCSKSCKRSVSLDGNSMDIYGQLI